MRKESPNSKPKSTKIQADLAMTILCDRMRLRGVLDVAERIAAHHQVTIKDIFGWSEKADVARRDMMKALAVRNVPMRSLGEWLSADVEELFELLQGDSEQSQRISVALGDQNPLAWK